MTCFSRGRRLFAGVAAVLSALAFVSAAPYNETYDAWNLNKNQAATDPTQYSTTRANTTYTSSPPNWRTIPFYTLLLDKFADGDPSNNNFFGLRYEHDWRETQLRFGGDVRGLQNKLDYLQGMGVRGIYIAGTPFLNMPWQADSYSPLDFSVLDPHWGTIDDWVSFIDDLHTRGMYIMMDFTIGTMGDMIGFVGKLNESAPFTLNEYDAVWKKPDYTPWDFDTYKDFSIGNDHDPDCQLPPFWWENGTELTITTDGCKKSDFDQYGDMEAFGVHPDWQRQLSKFASVQDRLREWQPAVMERLQNFVCMVIEALDIDAIRIDKATQVTVDALAKWSTAARTCAANHGKDNFLVTGEVTGGNTFGALYYGRGRMPDKLPNPDLAGIFNITPTDDQYFLRDYGDNGLDAVAFHYSIYRSLSRFLGMDGNLQVADDVQVNFVDAWNQIIVTNDFLNPATNVTDPKHMYGMSNFDVFRWPGLVYGTQKSALGTFIISLLMPGIPLLYFGEEQDFHIFDNGASNYMYGRQAMPGNRAWQRHGCYKLGSQQYFNFPLHSSLVACMDDKEGLDHFDPTSESRRLFKQFFFLREQYASLTDGLALVQRGNWTHFIQMPGSNMTETEIGLWTASRAGIPNAQTLTPMGNNYTGDVWLLYTNENVTQSYSFDCNSESWISTPYVSGTTIKNLIYPFETHTLSESQSSFFNDGNSPFVGCLDSITMEPYSFKLFVPEENWVAVPPMLTKFSPGHDARIPSDDGDNANIDIRLEFNVEMSCDGVTNALTLNMSHSDTGDTPSITNVVCGNLPNPDPPTIIGSGTSSWSWNATLTNMPDGIIMITLDNAPSTGGSTTGSRDHLLLRKGKQDNVMVFPDSDYDSSALTFNSDNNTFSFTHKAIGAEKLRYTVDFGQHWSEWRDWEAVTVIDNSTFFDDKTHNWWEGQHVIVQYWAEHAASSYHVVHADHDYQYKRRVPQFLGRGPFNTWGFDSGVTAQFEQTADNRWELELMTSWPTYMMLNVFSFDDYWYGDGDGDGIMDRLPPNTVAPNYLNLSAPPKPHLAWKIVVDDQTLAWTLEPKGESWIAAVMYALLVSIPILTGTLSVLVFMWSFYGIKYNKWGLKESKPSHSAYFPILGTLGNKSTTDLKDTSSEKHHGHAGLQYTGEIIGWPEDKNKRRCVLISTLEYEIIDWKLKVKIGGLGVMSSLMGKAMTDVDLIWVVPKVKDLEYPPGEPAEPIEVIIFGEPYLIEVETHVLDNITYVILDSPVFRAQTKADPYPARMDDLSSAIFYSTWNQAIAATVRRYPQIDIYHVNDYHGALAPIYLLPKVLPVCLSLHNAEFQGLWPLRTKEEMKEVCSAFNISKEHCTKYVQFGNTFNLLHAAASFISVHQKSIGVAGVSDKYGKRSWARYPALWTLKHVDSLPNPDPTDIAALDENPVSVRDIHIDDEAEAKRPEFKRQAQEWAGIKQDPKADLFVFVGRWSKQKGVDLIADVMPSLLEKRPSIQLICVGPVIDLYGRFAAEKLARLMELYPDRVYSKPEFTALPPYLFSGADFALIPSRDEPFGLVAVEFGRKGALGVGSRLGGLGLMPGWWFPVESMSTAHMQSQLSKTIKMALKSTEEERALLRARSAVQRFPVVEWRQRMEDFHKRSIQTSRQIAGRNAWRPSDGAVVHTPQVAHLDHDDWDPVHQAEPSQPEWDTRSMMESSRLSSIPPSPGGMNSPGQWSQSTLAPPRFDEYGRRASEDGDSDYFSTHRSHPPSTIGTPTEGAGFENFLNKANKQIAKDHKHAPDPFLDEGAAPKRPFGEHSRNSSRDSIASIVDEKANSPLNKAIASFTDENGEVVNEFIQKLQNLSADNSKHELSIERYLQKSEEKFFHKVRKDKISSAASVRSSARDSVWGTDSMYEHSRPHSPSDFSVAPSSAHFNEGFNTEEYSGQIPNEKGEVVMTGVQIALARTVGGWPLYTIIIAAGQMLSATSFQITLLSGRNSQTDLQLYVLGAIFLASSVVWYALFRLKPAIYILSAPWIFFGIAFFIIGLPAVSSVFDVADYALQSAATWSYAVASSASFAFFGLNFGEEAGAATEVWMLRACIVQGSQQIWVAALWYWGHELNGRDSSAPPWWVVLFLWPLAVMSFAFAYLMLYGLPEYYRQVPPKVPNFFKTLFRRKLVLWFLAAEILRDYWLSGPYGRNWTFLWNVPIPKWATLVLIVVFFVFVWGILMGILTYFSKIHTWLLPVFAVGLGAPRWAQMLWGTSSIAYYLPWAGKSGPYLGISLWLWLGVLDAIQGVGLGMILLQTLSRLHVCATLAIAQVIGSICVMVARATAPNRIGPGNVFPDVGTWDLDDGIADSPLGKPAFWIALICQLIIVVGYFWFYRKEQLARP